MITGIIFALVAAFCYAAACIPQKKLYEDLDSIRTTVLVTFFLSVSALIILLVKSTFVMPSGVVWWVILAQGIIGPLGFFAMIKSFEVNSVGETLAIANTSPFFIALIAYLIGRNVMSWVAFIPLIVVFIGVAMMLIDGWKFSKTLLIPFVTAIAWAFYGTFVDYLLGLGLGIYNVVFFLEMAIFVGTFTMFLIVNKFNIMGDVDALMIKGKNLWNGGLGGVLTMVGSLMLAVAISFIGPAFSNSINSSSIAFGSLLDLAFFGKKISGKHIAGMCFIAAGVIAFNFV